MKRQKDMKPEDEPTRLVDIQYATGKEWIKSSWKTEEAGPKQKWLTVVYVSGGESTVRCYKKQYWTETWNVRSKNQGKLDLVKQEMSRLSTKILRISELKWTGMGKFGSDDNYIY